MNGLEFVLRLVNSANFTDDTNTTNPTLNCTKSLPINLPYVDSFSGLWAVWAIALLFVLLSWVLSFYLIYKHLKFYTQPEHQRYIVRLICMVPLYGVYSLLSLIFHKHQTYFAIARDCYEAYALFMFFKLCVSYGGGKEAIVEHFLSLPKLKLTFPLNCWSVQPNELFFTVCKQGMLQYVLVRPIVSIWAALLEMFGAYGDGSFSVSSGYLYASFINNVCVCIALYIVVLFEQAATELLHPYRPILKFLSVKLVIFLAFWQSIMIAFFVHLEWIPPVLCLSSGDVATGLNNFLMCVEMFFVALLHIVAFPYELYRVRALTNAPINTSVKSSVLKNMVNMMNQADLVKDTLESLSIHRGKHKDTAEVSAHPSAPPMPHPFASNMPIMTIPITTAEQNRKRSAAQKKKKKKRDEGLLVNASVEPESEAPPFLEEGEGEGEGEGEEDGEEEDYALPPFDPAPFSPPSGITPNSDTDFNPRHRGNNPLLEMDELADDDLLDELDELDEDMDYEHLRR